jgi:DNA polymerase family A
MNIPNWPLTTPTAAIDYESTYSKGKRDITTLGTAKYLSHVETKIYLVSIHGRRPDGTVISYSGPVETAPWREIDGWHWVSHNAAFDASVFIETKRRGQMPGAEDVAPVEWDCTANLAAFLGSSRSLAAASLSLLGITVDKTVRDEMNGKTWETMTPEFREASIAYALKDAELCWQLWNGYGATWPAQEVFASRHTMSMVMNGVAVDLPYVEAGLSTLKGALWEAEQKIPWIHELDAKGKPYTVGSKKQLALACIAVNIPPPTSTADKNDAFDKWIDLYEEQAPFVRAVKDHRSINRTLDLLEKFRDRRFDDGRMPYDLKYAGAHTLRWSGGSGLNLQNLTKKKIAGVDVRGCIYPAPGKKFIVADLKQIEARVSLWFAGDFAQLELLRNGMDVYEAHARATMGYKDPMVLAEWVKLPGRTPTEALMRQIAKARVLGLGFGMGHVRLIDFAKTQLGVDLSVQQAKQIVNGFRAANPGIVKFWTDLENAMRDHAIHAAQSKTNEPFKIELPSWRSLEYYDVSLADGLQARDEMGGRETHWFGGKLAENCLAADTEVLTEKRGWVRLDSVVADDRVWDGVEWVNHDGLVAQGERETIDFGGVRMTPDHKVLVGDRMVAAAETTHAEVLLAQAA